MDLRVADRLGQAPHVHGLQAALPDQHPAHIDREPDIDLVVEIDEKDNDTWRLLAVCNYSVASLALDDQFSENKAQQTETLNKVWKIMTGAEGTFNQDAVWQSTESALVKGTTLFPDDMGLCKMIKVTYAQLNKVDELRKWASKCP